MISREITIEDTTTDHERPNDTGQRKDGTEPAEKRATVLQPGDLRQNRENGHENTAKEEVNNGILQSNHCD